MQNTQINNTEHPREKLFPQDKTTQKASGRVLSSTITKEVQIKRLNCLDSNSICPENAE